MREAMEGVQFAINNIDIEYSRRGICENDIK